MPKTREITLGGKVFAVPPLPIRLNKVAYPLCLRLVKSKPATDDEPAVPSLFDRIVNYEGKLECSAAEMDDLADLAYLAASAADPTLTRAAFDEMPVTPPELGDALFDIRYQTGGWRPFEQSEPATASAASEG